MGHRDSDAATALERIGELLNVHGSDLQDLKVHGQHISRNKGFLQRFRRLSGRLIRDGDGSKSGDGPTDDSSSIATSWATFLLTDDPGAAPTDVDANVDSPKV